MRQRTKFAIALVFVMLVVGGVVFVGLQWFQSEAERQAQEELRATAKVVANQTEAELGRWGDTVRRFGSAPESANQSIQGRELAAFARNTKVNNAVIIDPDGHLIDLRGNVDAETRAELLGTNVSTENTRESYREGSIVASNPTWNADDQTYYLQIYAPNYDADGQKAGVVGASIEVGEFVSPAETIETDLRTSRVTAWNGSAVVTLKETSPAFERELRNSTSGDPLISNESASNFGLSWTVTLKTNPQDLADRLDNLTLLGSGSLLVVFFAVLGLGYWEYNTNLKQTERLLDGFSKLRDGEYEYTISLSSATEWQRISDGYNELTQGLAEREREIREREQQLEVLNRVLRHNLQNDMNVIIGHAEMLPRYCEDERVEDAAETIVRMGEGLVSHGQKARHLETVMSGEDEMVTLDAVRVIEGVIDRFGPDASDTDIRVAGPDEAPVRVSSTFEYAIENLIENAIEHNDADEPFVEIDVAVDPESVTISIADNGPGIPDHEYEVLQEGAETALQHGSGVGLWLAHWIVDRSSGELAFADRSPRGSVVTVTVPAGDPGALDGTAAD